MALNQHHMMPIYRCTCMLHALPVLKVYSMVVSYQLQGFLHHLLLSSVFLWQETLTTWCTYVVCAPPHLKITSSGSSSQPQTRSFSIFMLIYHCPCGKRSQVTGVLCMYCALPQIKVSTVGISNHYSAVLSPPVLCYYCHCP